MKNVTFALKSFQAKDKKRPKTIGRNEIDMRHTWLKKDTKITWLKKGHGLLLILTQIQYLKD